MYCQNCGAELANGTKFCSSCGTEQKIALVDKKIEKSKIKNKKARVSIIIVILMIVAVATSIVIINYNTNNLTIEEVRAKFLEAQEVYKEWSLDPFVSPSDSYGSEYYDTYNKVVGEVDTKEEIESILTEHFTYDVCEDLFKDFYEERNGNLYFHCAFYGTEGDTVITADRLYKTGDSWFYELDSTYYDGYANGAASENEPLILKLVKQDGKWVFDDFSVYIALYEFE